MKTYPDTSACLNGNEAEPKLNSPGNLQVRHTVPNIVKMSSVSVLPQKHSEICKISQILFRKVSASEM
jgi:hypothetical protein